MRRRPAPCVDHTGTTHAHFSAMCRAWGQTPRCVRERLRAVPAPSLKEALTKPARVPVPVVDGAGVKHPSIRAAARCWGKTHSAVLRAAKRNPELTLSSALVRLQAVKDPRGKMFASLALLAEHWGVSAESLRRHIRSGKPMREALAAAAARHPKDHLGRRYRSMADMARAWGLVPATLRRRLNDGRLSLRVALTAKVEGRSA